MNNFFWKISYAISERKHWKGGAWKERMPSLLTTLSESYRRLVSKLLPRLLRSPDRIDEAAEIRRAGDAGCIGDEPKARTRPKPKRDPVRNEQSPAMKVRGILAPNVTGRKYITWHNDRLRVRIYIASLGKIHVGIYDDIRTAVKARNQAVKYARSKGVKIKCCPRD